jgi:hypothetical protein
MMKKFVKIAAVLGALLVSPPTFAQNDYAKFSNPWRIHIGGFWPESESSIGINGQITPPKPPVAVEDALKLDDSSGTTWGGISWHFKQRHSLQFEHFSLNREGGVATTFDPPVEIADFIIESGAIATSYDTSLSRLTYGYSIMRSDRMDFALKGGLHVAKLEAGLAVAGEICGPDTTPSEPPDCPPNQSGTARDGVTAPLPHFGASFDYAMTPNLAFSLDALGFAIELDSIEGSIIEIDADIMWQPFQHFGIGAGLRYFNTNVKAGNSTLNGEFDFEYLGPVLYIQASF